MASLISALPRNRSHRAAGVREPELIVRIKGSGTNEEFR